MCISVPPTFSKQFDLNSRYSLDKLQIIKLKIVLTYEVHIQRRKFGYSLLKLTKRNIFELWFKFRFLNLAIPKNFNEFLPMPKKYTENTYYSTYVYLVDIYYYGYIPTLST